VAINRIGADGHGVDYSLSHVHKVLQCLVSGGIAGRV